MPAKRSPSEKGCDAELAVWSAADAANTPNTGALVSVPCSLEAAHRGAHEAYDDLGGLDTGGVCTTLTWPAAAAHRHVT